MKKVEHWTPSVTCFSEMMIGMEIMILESDESFLQEFVMLEWAHDPKFGEHQRLFTFFVTQKSCL